MLVTRALEVDCPIEFTMNPLMSNGAKIPEAFATDTGLMRIAEDTPPIAVENILMAGEFWPAIWFTIAKDKE